jgi:hypothetical protein
MRRLSLHQRVIVHRTAYGFAVGGIAGTVTRLRRADDAAWVQLDHRHDNPEVHSFPADDDAGRSTHVVAWPEDCELERLRVVRAGGER